MMVIIVFLIKYTDIIHYTAAVANALSKPVPITGVV